MKHLLPLLVIPAICPAHEESGNELLYGVEVVTGYRTEYVHRGFKLADDFLDIQLQTEVALSDHLLLNLGGWHGSGDGGFDETAAFVDLSYDARSWAVGLGATWRGLDHPVLDSGLDIGPFFNWHPHDDWRIGTSLSYDTGPRGWYGELQAEWSKPVSEDSFVTVLSGASVSSSYYDRGGFNDLYSRLAYTYQINRHVAVTPFVGTSIALESQATTRLYAGVWFEVSF